MKRVLPYAIVGVLIASVAVIFMTRSHWLPRYTELTQGQAKPGLTFAVIGDTEGHADLYQAALTQAHDLGASFMIHLGDLSEDGSEAGISQMTDIGKNSGLKTYNVVGNHDIRVDETRALFTKYLNQPNLAFDAGQFRFLLLDNADRTIGFSDQTLQFVSDDLASHPDATYVLAYHRPFDLPLAAILGDDETKASRVTNERLVETISQAKVAAIFSGHLHIYLPYTLHGIRAFISGGGGGEPQAALGPLGNQARHFLLVQEDTGGKLRVTVEKL